MLSSVMFTVSERASWLPSIISWTVSQVPALHDDSSSSDEEEDEDVRAAFNKLTALYTQAQEASRSTNKVRARNPVCLPSLMS